jgi:hypothetical protein
MHVACTVARYINERSLSFEPLMLVGVYVSSLPSFGNSVHGSVYREVAVQPGSVTTFGQAVLKPSNS